MPKNELMSETVTYTRLGTNGRLANQLFQIAATIAYAIDNNKSFGFPPWEYSKWMQQPLPEIAPLSIGEGQGVRFYSEPHFHYAPIPALPGNVDLFGHFQSEKYFAHRKNDILPYLTLKAEHQDYIMKKYGNRLWNEFGSTDKLISTCSIHVRRTDYDTEVNRDYHGIMPKEYYEAAAKAIYGDNLQNTVFVICGDDIRFCKETFNFPKMLFWEGEPNIIDLFIMSYCQNHIIANSSFSWWSAWLGVFPDKKVVSPQKWFNNAPHNSKDVHCENWIVL